MASYKKNNKPPRESRESFSISFNNVSKPLPIVGVRTFDNDLTVALEIFVGYFRNRDRLFPFISKRVINISMSLFLNHVPTSVI